MVKTPDNVRQHKYRKRRAEKLNKANAMEASLRAIYELVKDSKKGTGQAIRNLAEEALKEDDK